jgi:hypothetical protein
MLAGLLGLSACATQPRVTLVDGPSGTRGGVTLLAPRCADASSCVVGHVTAAESGSPLSHAAVFLQLEAETADSAEPAEEDPRWILALTDEQGVFEIDDPPPGRYRLSVYAPPREIEMVGVELGARGTTVVPVRLPPG